MNELTSAHLKEAHAVAKLVIGASTVFYTY